MAQLRGLLGTEKHRKFCSLSSERQRIEFLLEEDIYRHIKIKYEEDKKCSKRASQFRSIGNDEFHKKHYLKALEFYTRALFSADVSEPGYALALANRSAALFYLEQYNDAIKDITLALLHGYPHKKCHKLYERRGNCYKYLGKYPEAIDDWRKVTELCKENGDSKCDILSKNVELLIAERKSQLSSGSRHTSVQDAIKEEQPVNPVEMVSTFYSVDSSPTKGRHVVAAADLVIGDVINCEKPFVSVMFRSSHLNRCWNCFKQTFSLIPSSVSCRVGFCCTSCLEEAKSNQETETRFLETLQSPGFDRLGHLVLRIIFKVGFTKMQHLYEILYGNEKDTKVLEDDNLVKFIQLANNSEDRSSDSWTDLSFVAIFILKMMNYANFFPEVPSDDTLIETGTVILYFLEILQCNAIGISEMDVKSDFSNCGPKDIGLGVYLTSSMYNHSCDASAEFNFIDNCCIVRALKYVKAGCEITCDYGPVFYLQSKTERQKLLKENYMFDCDCVACENDWPIFQSLPYKHPKFKCSKCLNCLDGMNGCKTIVCKSCKHKLHVNKTLSKLTRLHDRYALVMSSVTPMDFQEAIPVLKEYFNALNDSVCNPWRDIVSCQALIKQFYRLMANKTAICTF